MSVSHVMFILFKSVRAYLWYVCYRDLFDLTAFVLRLLPIIHVFFSPLRTPFKIQEKRAETGQRNWTRGHLFYDYRVLQPGGWWQCQGMRSRWGPHCGLNGVESDWLFGCSFSQIRDSTPEPAPKAKRAKSKPKKKTSLPETELNFTNEEDFQITSKSKAHKNIKVDPKSAYGGNILEPRWVFRHSDTVSGLNQLNSIICSMLNWTFSLPSHIDWLIDCLLNLLSFTWCFFQWWQHHIVS